MPSIARSMLLAVFATMPLVTSVVAQTYPSQPIRLVVGAGPGSIADGVARPLADKLGAALGQAVVVENKPGPGGIVGMDAVARAKSDGYTLGLATMSQLVFNPYLFSKLPYDPAKDLVPVANLVSGPMVIAVHPSYPAKSLGELIEAARAQPGKLYYAVPALGSPPHVVSLLVWKAANASLTAVPFRSGADAVTNVLSGEIPVLVDAPPLIAAHVKTGKLRALAVTGELRDSSLPDTPTLAEAGMAGVRGEAWIGLVAPTGTPHAVLQQLNQEIVRVLGHEEIARAYRAAGWRIVAGSAESFAAQVSTDRERWGVVIQESGIRLD